MTRRAPHEGTIRRRSDGRWEAVLHLGYQDGKRLRKSYYGDTRREVQKRLVAAMNDLQRGVLPSGDRLTTAQFLEAWLAGVKPTVRPRTLVSYTGTVDLHLKPVLGRTPLSKLTPQQIQSLLTDKLKSGLSPRSVQYIHTVLRMALNQAVRWDLVARNVATLTQPPRAPRSEIKPLDPAQARAFLEAVKEDRLGAMYSVAVALGLRLGEILGLRWSDVDFEGGTIRVAQSLQRVGGHLDFVEPKSQRSRRTIPMPSTVALSLQAHHKNQLEEARHGGSDWNALDLVFVSTVGTPLDARNVTRRFHASLKAAGLPRLRFHDLRHTCATLLLAQGVQPRVIMETLGHSQIGLTMDTYAHVIPALQREAADRMESILGGS